MLCLVSVATCFIKIMPVVFPVFCTPDKNKTQDMSKDKMVTTTTKMKVEACRWKLGEKQLMSFTMSSKLSVSPSFLICCFSLSVCLCLSTHKGVMQLAGCDTLTTISAEVCRATHTHTHTPRSLWLFPQQGRPQAVYLIISLGDARPSWVSRGGCMAFS